MKLSDVFFAISVGIVLLGFILLLVFSSRLADALGVSTSTIAGTVVLILILSVIAYMALKVHMGIGLFEVLAAIAFIVSLCLWNVIGEIAQHQPDFSLLHRFLLIVRIGLPIGTGMFAWYRIKHSA